MIKWALKILLKIFLFILVILLITLGTVNFWLPSTVNKLIRKYSGFSSKIEKSACRPLKGKVDLTNFEIENQTPGFSDKRFLSINKFVADVDVSSLIKGNEAIAEEIIIDINNIAVIKSAGNEYNFQVFANNIKNNTTSSDKKESKDRDKSDSSKSKKFLIKKLKLALGSVDYVDESSNSKKTYSINYEHEFTNVNDVDIIKKQLISDLKKYGLEFVIDYILSSIPNIGNVALDTLSKGKDIALQVTGDVKDAVVDVAGAATDAVGSAFGKVFGK